MRELMGCYISLHYAICVSIGSASLACSHRLCARLLSPESLLDQQAFLPLSALHFGSCELFPHPQDEEDLLLLSKRVRLVEADCSALTKFLVGRYSVSLRQLWAVVPPADFN